jgi:hypothetical protein
MTDSDGGECQRLAICDTLYDNVNKGGAWFPQQVANQLAVASVDVHELVANGCAGIAGALTVLYTAAHPNLGSVSISMAGPGGPYGFTLPAPADPHDNFGTATNGFTVSTLPKCAYVITLAAEVLVTTGDAVPPPVYDQVAFCKA